MSVIKALKLLDCRDKKEKDGKIKKLMRVRVNWTIMKIGEREAECRERSKQCGIIVKWEHGILLGLWLCLKPTLMGSFTTIQMLLLICLNSDWSTRST